jgi:hypothetical protein
MTSLTPEIRVANLRRRTSLTLLFMLLHCHITFGQTIPQYTVQRCATPLTIDGKLTEPDWFAAPFTARFVHHTDGSTARLSTQAKLLWDDHFLYIGFVCEDPDVWATLTKRDASLWNGEVVEIICDPDGDGLNYFELQVNPLETLLDLTLTKAYSAGGQANLAWTLNFTAAVWVDGTLDDSTDVDAKWCCEVAVPFNELAFMAPTLHFPPHDGETWRILLTRYDYERTGSKRVELSAWAQTNSSSFHVPASFGSITFSANPTVAVERQAGAPPRIFTVTNYPNPCNPTTVVSYQLPEASQVHLAVYDLLGREVAVLVNEKKEPGSHEVQFDAVALTSGVYLYRVTAGSFVQTRKMVVAR